MIVGLPDVAGQVGNVPVKMLRGIFAGIGRMLLAADRFGEQEVTSEQAVDLPGREPADKKPDHGQPPQPTRFRSLDETGNVRILAPDEPQEPEPEPEHWHAPEPGHAPADPGEAAQLPVPGYDGRSLPSLRSRLRSLNASQVRALLEYEKSHAGRHDVVMMFERRITRLDSQAVEASGPDAS